MIENKAEEESIATEEPSVPVESDVKDDRNLNDADESLKCKSKKMMTMISLLYQMKKQQRLQIYLGCVKQGNFVQSRGNKNY